MYEEKIQIKQRDWFSENVQEYLYTYVHEAYTVLGNLKLEM